jgi:hypothetical protein
MTIKKYISLLLILTLALKINAQTNKTEIIDITAKIINLKNNKPVGYATIVNLKKGNAALSDSLGYFHISMQKSDEIKITALGFERKFINFKDSAFEKLKVYNIYLEEKTYNIDKINIYEARWKEFEYEFANIDIKNNDTQEKILNWFQSIISTQELALITSAAAIGIPINYVTDKEKQRIKVKEMETADSYQEIIKSKFNEKVVYEITGLTKQNAIDFIQFCDFSDEFILESNEYDLVTEIKKRFAVYKKKNSVNFK